MPNENFRYANVSFNDEGGVVGEITNETGRDYQAASFALSVYNANGQLLEVAAVNVLNFQDGETQSFAAYTDGLPERGRWKIQFSHGY